MTRLPFQRARRPMSGSSTPPPEPFRIAPTEYWPAASVVATVVPNIVGLEVMTASGAGFSVGGAFGGWSSCLSVDVNVGLYDIIMASGAWVPEIDGRRTLAFWMRIDGPPPGLFAVANKGAAGASMYNVANDGSSYALNLPFNQSFVTVPVAEPTLFVWTYDVSTNIYHYFANDAGEKTGGGPSLATPLFFGHETAGFSFRGGRASFAEIAVFPHLFSSLDVADLYAWGLAGKRIAV